MDQKQPGRGRAFSEVEKKYIVAKCIRAIQGKEEIRDEDIAITLDRAVNNISINRRNLGFIYKQDPKTGQQRLVYKRPKKTKYYIDIDHLNINEAIAIIEMREARKKLLQEGKEVDEIKLIDFYPEYEYTKINNEDLEIITKNILSGNHIEESKETSKKQEFEDKYDDDQNENEQYRVKDDFIEKEEEEEEEDKKENTAKVKEDKTKDIIEIAKEESSDSEEENIFFDSIAFEDIKSALDEKEWKFFKFRWKAYMNDYSDAFNGAEDFDDLTGLILELIKRNRLVNKEHKDYGDYSKELSECNKRYETYKKTLATSRNSRISRNVDDRLNIADLIVLFEDDAKYLEYVYAAEKELAEVATWAKQKLQNPKTKDEIFKVDGNEANLLVGVDLDQIDEILES